MRGVYTWPFFELTPEARTDTGDSRWHVALVANLLRLYQNTRESSASIRLQTRSLPINLDELSSPKPELTLLVASDNEQAHSYSQKIASLHHNGRLGRPVLILPRKVVTCFDQ
ncbi:MAG: hypothetical protein KDD55_00965 [Bdellovibrionales bacterium]|nr:hypothetical protein [Bdellovibrionales bacterium]